MKRIDSNAHLIIETQLWTFTLISIQWLAALQHVAWSSWNRSLQVWGRDLK